MSIARLASVAANYSRSMDQISAQAGDPDVVSDPAKLAMFQMQLFTAQSGYTLTARAMQDMNNEDKILAEMLRDA